MNNLNIQNLFCGGGSGGGGSGGGGGCGNGNGSNMLDITNISSNNIIKNTLNDEYIVKKIKYNEKHENKMLNQTYEHKYVECLTKINNAIDHNLTDICYSPICAEFGIKKYSSNGCLYYIQEKLRKKNFETLIFEKEGLMFISWKK
jgi:hypothetical protein